MMQLIYDNKSTLPTPQREYHHVQIGIIMKLTLYTTLSTTAWIIPPDPVV